MTALESIGFAILAYILLGVIVIALNAVMYKLFNRFLGGLDLGYFGWTLFVIGLLLWPIMAVNYVVDWKAFFERRRGRRWHR